MSFKVFGVVPLTFLFAALQYPLLTKYAAPEAKRPTSSDYVDGIGASAFSIAGFNAVSRFSGVIGPISL